jgi:Peptidase family M1 domain
MKRIAGIVACLIHLTAFTQTNYWQQQVNYKINVSLNDKNNSLKGTEELEYINNSPDQLNFIWFHLWENAYKNDSTAFAKQLLRDKKGIDRLKKFADRGYIDSLNFTVDGIKASIEKDPENIDVVKLILPKPLQPGGKIKIQTPFYIDIPQYISRSGHDDQSYMICQWYPKPAVYDRKGWHQFPYLDMGEFYSEYGDFDVSITLPSQYIVGATGVLQNADELKQYKEIGSSNVASSSRKNSMKYVASSSPTKTLNYKGERILDFAWFADKDFVVRYDTMQLSSGKTVDVFTYHHPDGNKNWIRSTDYVKSGARAYSSYFGEYPYPVVQAVEGPKNEMSGGMEYPMITLITSPDASEPMLDAVITHEVGHNWLMGILATNERTHGWMDEGINTYVQFRYEAEKYRFNSVFGDDIPREVKEKPAPEFQALVYNALSKIPSQTPIDTPSEDFANEEEYGIVIYIKTATWMYYMEQELGKENLDRAMKAYYEKWKFKHPYPEDMKAALEKELGKDLTPYFDLLKKKGNI